MAVALISTLVPLGVIAVGWLFRMQSELKAEMASRHSEWKASMEANSREHDMLAERISEVNQTLGRQIGEVNQTLLGMQTLLHDMNSRLIKIESRQELEAAS